MALHAVNLPSGTTSAEGFFRLLGRLFNQSGVIQSAAFTVTAQGTPDMTVRVSGSAAADDAFFVTATGNAYHGWSTANENVTIDANASGSAKTDAIVLYVNTALSSGTADNPGGLVLDSVRGASGAPTDGEINTAIGSKPFIRLATVAVANGASSINSGNITDARPFAGIAAARLASEAWTTYTPTLSASGGGTALGTGGTITGRYVRHGRRVTVMTDFAYGSSGASFGSGSVRLSVPVTPVNANFIGIARLVDVSVPTNYVSTADLYNANRPVC